MTDFNKHYTVHECEYVTKNKAYYVHSLKFTKKIVAVDSDASASHTDTINFVEPVKFLSKEDINLTNLIPYIDNFALDIIDGYLQNVLEEQVRKQKKKLVLEMTTEN